MASARGERDTIHSSEMIDRQFVDSANAPEFTAGGLDHIERIGGLTRLVFYISRATIDQGSLSERRECAIALLLPAEAVREMATLLRDH